MQLGQHHKEAGRHLYKLFLVSPARLHIWLRVDAQVRVEPIPGPAAMPDDAMGEQTMKPAASLARKLAGATRYWPAKQRQHLHTTWPWISTELPPITCTI
jgi:hypothetical protein